jgi:hypothetical protein
MRCEQCHSVDSWRNLKGRVSQVLPTSTDPQATLQTGRIGKWRMYG